MLNRDVLRRFLDDNFTYDLKSKDPKDKKIDSWPLYHDKSYMIQKNKPRRSLKLHFEPPLTMVANTSRTGTDLKISFPIIRGFTSLHLVAATKATRSGDQPSDETWSYFKNVGVDTPNDTPNRAELVCSELFNKEGNGFLIRIQVQLISNDKLEPNRVCPSFRLNLIFPMYATIGRQLVLMQKKIVEMIEEFEQRPNWSSFLVYISSKNNRQLLWMSKSEFFDHLIDFLKTRFGGGFYLFFDLALNGCFKYVFSDLVKGKTALVKNVELESEFRLNNFLLKDAMEVVKSMKCDPLRQALNTDCVMPIEKTLFVNSSSIFQSYFVFSILKRTYDEYVDLLSKEENKAVTIKQSPTEGIDREQADPPESVPTGSNQPEQDEPESDPAFEQYLARIMEFQFLHLIYMAVVDEVGTYYRTAAKIISQAQPCDEYKSDLSTKFSEFHHVAQGEASYSFREDDGKTSDGYICQPWSSKRSKHHKKMVYTKQVTDKIGRDGEEHAFHYLKDKYLKKHHEVRWLNRGAEAYLHYDFVVYDINNHTNLYYEAKTSSNPSKEWFLISPDQYDEAAKFGPLYTILHIHQLEDKHWIVTEYNDPTQNPNLKLSMTKARPFD